MIYVKFSDGSLGRYDGMSQETVEGLLEDRDYKFIDQTTYEAELAISHP